MGANTLLITQKFSTIGVMSCNPSFGGVGKGQLVREIDALDGLMGVMADKAGIHFRILNSSKGPAVQGLRCQADRDLYKKYMQEELSNTPNLTIMEGSVEDLILDGSLDKKVCGIVLSNGDKIESKNVILTTGTFLSGVILIGSQRSQAGRIGDSASIGLSKTLRNASFKVDRLKTGTPPRIDGNTINYDKTELQFGDDPPVPFSDLHTPSDLIQKQLPCFITRTTTETTEIVSKNIHLVPEFESGETGGLGKGPRYCPSLEVKVHRFPDRTHHIFLEPEGLNTNLIYPNGISISLPQEIQDEIVHSIPGLENALITQYGYAVEYDYVDPTELTYGLETKKIPGLFFAGQINGTTGYEEAGAQGIIAGINAALRAKKGSSYQPFILDRAEGYIGVLIDDLITRGVNEPYRMFTSRAEYRLSLRHDNADLRITDKGYNVGCVGEKRMKMFNRKKEDITRIMNTMQNHVLPSRQWSEHIPHFNVPDTQNFKKSAWEMLSRQNFEYSDFSKVFPEMYETSHAIQRFLKSESLYSIQIQKQQREIESFRKDENLVLPTNLNYKTLGFLSLEEREKLSKHQPITLGQAMRLEGITPAAIVCLHALCRQHRSADADDDAVTAASGVGGAG
eukprot:TRINITY_DN456_c1_g1_i1.p1 TRINITY_DN456_c1_g1~~TRINITY_DN456_c1_g1_i1.p1  ORF type:complete len:669 (+),score=155.09 TRINITY_DN456_c1_g1_i1:138-2009(+)